MPRPLPAAAGHLYPVNVSPDRVIRTLTGLRPFRPSGFVVRAETLEGKTVVHNYGHGGAGITLSWGTAHLAELEARKTGQREVAVVGAGAVGLAAARLFTERGYRVSIYTKDLPPDTTSNIAGGQWFPFTVYDVDCLTPEFEEQLWTAAEFAYRRYQTMAGDYYGIRWLPNFQMSDAPLPVNGLFARDSPLFAMLPEFADIAPGHHPFPFRYVRRFDTMFIEPPVYLEAMVRELRIAGVSIAVREFQEARDLASLPEPVVVNCTGLGAKKLFDDDELTPIKGQLTVLLPEPEVTYATLPPELYMFPRRDGIVLGGSHDRGVWDLTPDPDETARVLAGHAKIFRRMASRAGA
ncbi:MAG TPA: FAD-dependent oxidoreductase [Bryobacteraceae bacterium]|nr:FAD-dependent oxidoreductase [Bryobacteraceae bacterium]